MTMSASAAHSSGSAARAVRTLLIFATILVPAAAAVSGPALAAPASWEVDPAHSDVSFEVRHFFSMVPGRFDSFTGTFVFDEVDPVNSSIEFSIDASSVNTNNEKRDGHLKSPDFFHVENFPSLTFRSTKVEKADGENNYRVTGDFTMRGVTKPLTVTVEMLGVGPDAWGNTRGGFVVTGVIDRKEYGMVWNKTLDTGGTMLSDEVKLHVSLSLVKQTA